MFALSSTTSKAQKEFETTANDIEKARVLSLIGNAYYMQGNYESALISYQQALTLREQINDMSGEGDVLAGIGSTFIRKKNYSMHWITFKKL
jgi:tetratricopeptide (TPR) repeat protein